ncbi:NCS2 family permease [Shouchella lonarensis]|uniref:Putative MFS transporter, AGZA family, xanthine/uracil permease n=1 Tax=Shouchella lonarensis TaxID=1464122 RepID=A0A1G6IW92_9BACI|nr:putative MFS transporter, AGZA family, xanthine/uracil permease [Shouchella lonarensis]
MLKQWLTKFELKQHGTSVKQEFAAGMVGFLTCAYIVAINSTILADAGIPLAGAALATILTSAIGCIVMGLWSNMPIMLIPGMGINAMFTFTFVQSAGLSWQEALAVVFVSGLLFMVVAFTQLADLLNETIPDALKHAITAGIGLFLAFIGLQKGGLLVAHPETFLQLAPLSEAMPLATLCTLGVAMALYARQIPGHFLWTIVIGIGIGLLVGVETSGSVINLSQTNYSEVFGQFSFQMVGTVTFWTSVFALTMVLTFENIGLISGYTSVLKRPDKSKRALQANAVSAMSAGVFGTSPTVSTAETAAALSAGGKTGLTAVVTGGLFALTVLILPFLAYIPDSAIAPVLIIVGGLMMTQLRFVSFDDFLSWFPAYMVVVLIPLTHSIADGIAFGFVLYPLIHILAGKMRGVSVTMYIIGLLFFIHLLFSALSL